MPIYDAETRLKFYDRGMNPDDYDELVEAPPEPEIVQEQPIAQEPQALPQKKVGAIRSVLSNALAGFPSAAAALGAGAAAGSALAPAAAIPVIGPAIPLVGGIGAAILAGAGGRALQDTAIEKLAPTELADAYRSEMEATQTQHPLASTLGNVLSGLGTMRPSLNTLQSAGRALTNPLKGVGVSAAQKANLLNTGLGATVPVAQRAGQNIYNEGVVGGVEKTVEDIKKDPLSVLAEMAGGSLLNTPTALGRRLGIKAPPVDRPLGEGLTEKVKNSEVIQPIEPEARPERLLEVANAEVTPEANVPVGEQPNLTAIDQQLQAAPLTSEAAYARQVHAEALKVRAEAEAKLKAETERILAETEQIKAETERTNALIKQGMQGAEPQPNDPLYTPPKTVEQPLPLPEELQTKRTDLQEYRPIVEPDPSDINWQQKSNIKPLVQEQLEQKGIPTQRTKAYEDFIGKELAPQRGITVEKPGRMFDAKGEEILGQADIRKRVVKINPNKAQLDTDAHELFHPFLRDLKASPKTRDNALYTRINKLTEKAPDYQTWKTERKSTGKNASTEEYLSSLSGEDFVRRVFNADNTGKVKNWFKDFWAYQKTKFGKASDADIARVLSGKMLNDPSYAETFGTPTPKALPIKDAPAEKPSDTPEALGSRLAGGPPVQPSNVRPSRGIPILKPLVDKVRDIGTKESNTIADSADRFFENYATKKGELGGVAIDEIRKLAKINLGDAIKSFDAKKYGEYLSGDSPLMQSTLKKIYDQYDTGKPAKFTAEEQKIADIVRSTIQKFRNEVSARKGLTQVKNPDPNYFPSLPKLSVIRTIRENRNSPASQKYINEFINYHASKVIPTSAQQAKGITARDIAKENLETLLEGYNQKAPDLAKHFAEIDRAEGLGLPPSWRETNLLLALQRFTDRTSRRLAYHDTMENPQVQQALKTHSGDGVERLIEKIGGVGANYDRAFNAATGVFRSANIGTLSGLRDFTSNFNLGMQHQQNPWQTVKNSALAVTDLRKNIAIGVKTGRIRQNINELEWGENIGVLRRASDVLSDTQGRNFLEKITRGTSIGIGRLTTLDFLEQINSGKLSYTGKKWFENFADGIDWKNGKLSDEQINRIAARFVDSTQGTYDARGLPNFTMEGALSPLYALARWNVEKANNYNKHVIQPLLREKNPRPFLMSTIGMIAGGTAVKTLTEMITGRKDKTASYDELKATKEAGKDITLPLLYKALGLSTAAGYGGILSDMANAAMDKFYGKTKPRWYNNMLFEFASQSADSISSFAEALYDNPDDPNVWMEFAGNFIADNHQLSRLILSNIGKREEDIDKSNKFRDLRTFRLLEGKDVADYSTSEYSRKYTDKPIKDFKETKDLSAAVEMLPELIERAADKAGGDIEVLDKELGKLKRNSYQTMPNPDTIPLEFVKYYEFLKETQGKDEADKRLADYMEVNTLNKVKSSLVP